MFTDWAARHCRLLTTLGCLGVMSAIAFCFIYFEIRINVPAEHIAVLTRKTGQDIDNGDTVARILNTRDYNSPFLLKEDTSAIPTRIRGTCTL